MSLASAHATRRSAHRVASTAPVTIIASELQATLGPALTTVVLGIRDPKAISQWAKGSRHPRPAQETALRGAFQIVSLLSAVEEPDVIRAWFAGMNPDLDDRAPAVVYATDPIAVLRAAEAFVQNG